MVFFSSCFSNFIFNRKLFGFSLSAGRRSFLFSLTTICGFSFLFFFFPLLLDYNCLAFSLKLINLVMLA